MEEADMSTLSSDPSTVSVEADGRLVIPAQIVRAAGLTPGGPVILEVSDEEVFVRSQALAEAEDAQDAESVDRILGDPQDSETLPWEDVKRKLEP
jgi:bifunctional DNA-binding transcriptional regulator/antitoxin component of YhaV-PrlF toxin-antitoxin module